jgi:3-deoxy-7-phosphoheptulonate synthase
MMIVMKQGATDGQIQSIVDRVTAAGAQAHVSRGEFVTVIGAIGDDREMVAGLELAGEEGVEKVVPILKPYKLVSREFRHGDLPVEVEGVKVGGGSFGLIAGPCTVETREQTLDTARVVKAAGACMLRGGAYKPRTSPYTFQGLGKPALEILAEARAETGLPIVTELMDVRQLDDVLEVADVIQVGARNMQNFDLMKEIGRTDKAILLKRGLANTIEEWLLSAEYIAKEGNERIMLCERGIRTFETATRSTPHPSPVGRAHPTKIGQAEASRPASRASGRSQSAMMWRGPAGRAGHSTWARPRPPTSSKSPGISGSPVARRLASTFAGLVNWERMSSSPGTGPPIFPPAISATPICRLRWRESSGSTAISWSSPRLGCPPSLSRGTAAISS